MPDNIHFQAYDVKRYLAIARAGSVMRTSRTRYTEALNKAPQAKQVTTMAVSTGTANTNYVFVLNGYTFTYANGSETDTTAIATAIKSAANADPRVRGAVVVTSSTNTLTFTAVYPGISFTLTESDSKLGSPSTTTAAASASSIPFGRAVLRQASSASARTLCGLCSDASLSSQEAIVTFTYSASAVTVVTIHIPSLGVAPTAFSIAHDTNATTTGAALATAINNSALASYLTATNNSGAVTIAADVAGVGFAVSSSRYGAVTGDAEPQSDSDLALALLGISVLRGDVHSTTYGVTASAYEANEGVEILTDGLIAVASTETVDSTSPVYVGTGSDEQGMFFATSGTGRIKVSNGSLKWDRPGIDGDGSLTDGINFIRISLR